MITQPLSSTVPTLKVTVRPRIDFPRSSENITTRPAKDCELQITTGDISIGKPRRAMIADVKKGKEKLSLDNLEKLKGHISKLDV